MANLFDMKGGKMFAVLSKIAERMSPEIGDGIIKDPELVDAMMEAARKHLEKNALSWGSVIEVNFGSDKPLGWSSYLAENRPVPVPRE